MYNPQPTNYNRKEVLKERKQTLSQYWIENVSQFPFENEDF